MEKNGKWKRLGAVLGLCLVLMGMLGMLCAGTSTQCLQVVDSSEGILRLHVLANSDSDYDQQTKLLVRDALLPLFEGCDSYTATREFVLSHGKQVQEVCEQVLQGRGANYGVRLLLGKTDFPDRVYGDTEYPAGTYDALCVELGQGKGHNWWCVLFPPLCIVTEEGEPVDLNEVEFESDILTFLKAHFGRWFS